MEYYLGENGGGVYVIIPIAAVIYMGLLYLFVVSTFFLASFVDPGIYPRGEDCLGASEWCLNKLIELYSCSSCFITLR